LPEALRYKP